ncbi:MAG: DUF2235 domain-containing protein [Cyanobacteria bacterium P01_F01_bin.150]
MDENRETFSLTPMQKHPEFKEQTLHQVWFPGGHGCVGGGTVNESKLANNALLWMIASIKELGLKLEVDTSLLTDKEQLFGTDKSDQAYTDAAFDYEKHPEKSRLEKLVSGGRGAFTKIPGKHVRQMLDGDGLHRSVSERWNKVPDYSPHNVAEARIINKEILESDDSILLTS